MFFLYRPPKNSSSPGSKSDNSPSKSVKQQNQLAANITVSSGSNKSSKSAESIPAAVPPLKLSSIISKSEDKKSPGKLYC